MASIYMLQCLFKYSRSYKSEVLLSSLLRLVSMHALVHCNEFAAKQQKATETKGKISCKNLTTNKNGHVKGTETRQG